MAGGQRPLRLLPIQHHIVGIGESAPAAMKVEVHDQLVAEPADVVVALQESLQVADGGRGNQIGIEDEEARTKAGA